MPLKQKNTSRTKIIWAILIIAIVALMIISFTPPQNVTEIVLFQ